LAAGEAPPAAAAVAAAPVGGEMGEGGGRQEVSKWMSKGASY